MAPEGLKSCHGAQDAEEGSGGGGGDAGDLRHRRDGQGAQAHSSASRTVNTAFVERHNGTDRNRTPRKVRKTYCFSKDWLIHRAATFFSKYSYNFCWPVRTLKTKGADAQTPAMMARLADHVWTLAEWIKRPAVQLV